MKHKSISIRISAEEFEALKVMAKNEVRTVSSWIRSRIVSEAQKEGCLGAKDRCKTEKLLTDTTLQEGEMGDDK